VITRLLQVDASHSVSSTLLSSINRLVVRDRCDCGQRGIAPCDSIFFDDPRNKGHPVASGVGYMRNNTAVELILWAREDVITFLEVEPYNGARLPIFLPVVETIQSYPDDIVEPAEEDEEA
jgi:hypothetical protein